MQGHLSWFDHGSHVWVCFSHAISQFVTMSLLLHGHWQAFMLAHPYLFEQLFPQSHALHFSTISGLWVNKFPPTWPRLCVAWIDFSSNVSRSSLVMVVVAWWVISLILSPNLHYGFLMKGWLLLCNLLGLLRGCLQCWVATLLRMLLLLI